MKEMSHFDHAIRDWWTSSAIQRRHVVEKARTKCRKHRLCDRPQIAFQSYGKCESVKLFPLSFASCVNSGDVASMAKLVHSRMSKNCKIEMFHRHLGFDDFLKMFELIDQLYPDCVTSIQTIRTVGNQITAAIYVQYTVNKVIAKSIRESEGESSRLPIDVSCTMHSDPCRLKAYIESFPAEDQASVLAQVYSAEELIVRGQGVMSLTVSEKTGRIKCMSVDIAGKDTEFEVVDVKKLSF